ncbi:transglycosylase domain-containing protein [Dongia sedimenti]|uniref:peptidoglycan glycosyltransferase n=1 Tax=Dongia sedimenti TaxID=3064282 RepID=A0ABU0YI58_9PROT|nr:transglycosylase domain-containing protein [Rhodospirillaceae bacterium R-7]
MRNRRRRIALAAGVVAATLCAWGWFGAALVAPRPTPILLDRNGGFMAQIAAHDDAGYGYWEIADLPPRVAAATVALEDRRFWWHPGVDPVAIARAVWQNLASGSRVSGASTLAMQVARMQDPAPRNYLNKAREASTALFVTLRYGRAAVLRQYLKLAPYGNGSHGIAHAARFYFDKPVADLSWAEIAFLAAIPQAPSRMNPLLLDGRADAITRGQRILDALRAGAVITETEYALASSQLDHLPLLDRRTRPENALHAILNLQRMIDPDEVRATDPRITTTIARAIQREVEASTKAYLDRWRKDGAEQAAAVVVDVATGEVLAWVGSAGYYQAGTGAIDFALTERSPGSALKPFIYALALDRGAIGPETKLLDTAFSAGTIANSDRSFLGVMTPRRALANSRNVPAANLTKAIGLDETFLYLRLLGINAAERPASYYGLSLSVGALPTTLEKLTRAYLALADDGVMRELVWLRNTQPRVGTRVMSVDAARLVTQFLADPSARLPSFPRMGSTEYPFPVAIKTGTSQGYRDAWTMAFSRKYLVGVWVGRSDAGPMRDVTGAGSAAELARAILLDLHGDVPDVAAMAFPAPPNYRLGAEKLPEWTNGKVVAKAAAVDAEALTELTPASEESGGVTIVSPRNNMRVIRNPELPADLASLPLKAALPPGASQVVWYVDGKPFLVGQADATARWPLQPGVHTFEAKVPYRGLASSPVTIEVE